MPDENMQKSVHCVHQMEGWEPPGRFRKAGHKSHRSALPSGAILIWRKGSGLFAFIIQNLAPELKYCLGSGQFCRAGWAMRVIERQTEAKRRKVHCNAIKVISWGRLFVPADYMIHSCVHKVYYQLNCNGQFGLLWDDLRGSLTNKLLLAKQEELVFGNAFTKSIEAYSMVMLFLRLISPKNWWRTVPTSRDGWLSQNTGKKPWPLQHDQNCRCCWREQMETNKLTSVNNWPSALCTSDHNREREKKDMFFTDPRESLCFCDVWCLQVSDNDLRWPSGCLIVQVATRVKRLCKFWQWRSVLGHEEKSEDKKKKKKDFDFVWKCFQESFSVSETFSLALLLLSWNFRGELLACFWKASQSLHTLGLKSCSNCTQSHLRPDQVA